MSSTMLTRKSNVFVLLAPSLLLIAVSARVQQPSTQQLELPKRLLLRAERSTLRKNDKTQLIVEFLDRNYKRVPNDRNRIIQFTTYDDRTLGGRGAISPEKITVEAGTSLSQKATFTATVPGKLRIKATSTSLASSSTLIVITQQQASFLSRLFDFTVHAEPDAVPEISGAEDETYYANGTSLARLEVSLASIDKDRDYNVEVRTDPQRNIRVGQPDTVEVHPGLVTIRLTEDERSKDIYVSSLKPGPVQVSARIRETGRESKRKTLEFSLPIAKRIYFKEGDNPEKRLLIGSHVRESVVMIGLKDESEAQIEETDQDHMIVVISPSHDPVYIEPQRLTLPRQSPSGQVSLRFDGVPENGEGYRLSARDEQGKLDYAELTIVPESLNLDLSDFGELNCNSERPLTIQLMNATGKTRYADWDRTITVEAQVGNVRLSDSDEWANSTKVPMPKGAPDARLQYRAPGSSGKDTISATSSGLTAPQKTITVILPLYTLVIFAGVGGMLGGLIRHVYKDRVRHILPKWTRGKLAVGLIGNALFSVVFGVVLFLAARQGLVKIIASLDTREAAFITGIVAGYGGILVLDRLLRLVFPEEKNLAAHG